MGFFPVVYPCRALGYMSFHRLQYPRLRRLAVSDCSQDRALPVCRRLYADLVVREAPESVTLFPARKLRWLPAQERLVDPEGASEHDSILAVLYDGEDLPHPISARGKGVSVVQGGHGHALVLEEVDQVFDPFGNGDFSGIEHRTGERVELSSAAAAPVGLHAVPALPVLLYAA